MKPANRQFFFDLEAATTPEAKEAVKREWVDTHRKLRTGYTFRLKGTEWRIEYAGVIAYREYGVVAIVYYCRDVVNTHRLCQIKESSILTGEPMLVRVNIN